MIRHDVYLDICDWSLTLFYNAKPHNTPEIMDALWNIGIPTIDYYEAERMLMSGETNEGLTFNNSLHKQSVVVIGHVSDMWELIDTIEHEGRHLIQGICKRYNIDSNSEYAAYLEGKIFKHVLKDLMKNFEIK